MPDFRKRLTANANDFDQIVSEILSENEALRAKANNLLVATEALLDKHTGGTYGLPASHKDVIAVLDAIKKMKQQDS